MWFFENAATRGDTGVTAEKVTGATRGGYSASATRGGTDGANVAGATRNEHGADSLDAYVEKYFADVKQ